MVMSRAQQRAAEEHRVFALRCAEVFFRRHGIPPRDRPDFRSAAVEAMCRAVASYQAGRGMQLSTWVGRNVDWALADAVKVRVLLLAREAPLPDGWDRPGLVDPFAVVDEAAVTGQLPDQLRYVYRRVYIDGVQRKQVAAELGVVPSRVSQLLRTIRDRLGRAVV